MNGNKLWLVLRLSVIWIAGFSALAMDALPLVPPLPWWLQTAMAAAWCICVLLFSLLSLAFAGSKVTGNMWNWRVAPFKNAVLQNWSWTAVMFVVVGISGLCRSILSPYRFNLIGLLLLIMGLTQLFAVHVAKRIRGPGK